MEVIFELRIGATDVPGTFRVEVLRSEGGTPEGRLVLDTDSILNRRGELENAVLASGVQRRRGRASAVEAPLREVGQQLFEALFNKRVYGAYRASMGAVQNKQGQLQVMLHVTEPELAALPWEALYDPEISAYLCLNEPLVRCVESPYTPSPPLKVKPPLRILGLVASPGDLPELAVEVEKRRLETALATPRSQGRVDLKWAPDARFGTVHDLMLSGKWHILHFIGHGDFDASADEGYLMLAGQDGRADRVEASRLANLLREADPIPRLVVLNSCSSGETGGSDLFSGTAAMLVHRGVSAVAAMQFRVSDTAAINFARGFYTSLAAGRPIDLAVRSGRVGISGLEWITPVLYVRAGLPQLFALPKPKVTGAVPYARGRVSRAERQGRTTPQERHEPVQASGSWSDRIVSGALRAAYSIPDDGFKSSGLARIAGAMVANDPDRAERIITDAERIAESITDESRKASALGSVAEVVAAIDPDRAERIAGLITDNYWRSVALRSVAGALAATDPDRAERIGRSITDEFWQALAFRDTAAAVAATDPDRAERIAHSITREDSKASALVRIAKVVAATDPGRAERLITDAEHTATSITDEGSKAFVLAGIGEVVAATDPGRAERLITDAEHSATSITDEGLKAWALARVAEVVAATGLDRTM
jgi:hypothetical protein